MTPGWVHQKTLYLGFLPASNSEPLAYETFIQMSTTLTTEATVLDGLRAFLQHSIDVKREEHTPFADMALINWQAEQAAPISLIR